MNKAYIHLVSDSTGDTIQTIAKTVMAMFDNVKAKPYYWNLIKTKAQLNRVIEVIKKRPGIIMYTLADEEFIVELKTLAKKINAPCIEPLKPIISDFANYLEQIPSPGAGRQHVIDDEYFQRIEAINFTIANDDGQSVENLKNADIILVGPSRTSKSPTSIYLAYKGYKTANIPYVSGTKRLFNPDEIRNKCVIGLAICSKMLVEIRRSRLVSLGERHLTEYIDTDKVESEMLEARRFCALNKWPVIDISHKSIEEIAARVIQIYHDWRSIQKATT